MRQRLLYVVCLLLVSYAESSYAQPTFIDPPVTGYPLTVVALGDSITRAFLANGNLAQVGEQPQYSWSTGSATEVNSITRRINAVAGQTTGQNYAITGGTSATLNGQAQQAASVSNPLYTILIGGNDACASNVNSMTSVSEFRTRLITATQTIMTNDPEARMMIVSIPNVYNLWNTFKDNQTARLIWSTFTVCQSMLANPTSTQPADEARRQAVRQRIVDYNSQLATVCSEILRCCFDNNLVFSSPVSPTLVTADYFHPSIAGQRDLATAIWERMFDFNDTQTPTSSVIWNGIPFSNQVTATITGTDNVGVRGFEYRLSNQTTWTRYIQSFTIPAGTSVIVRGVDVNGNTEGSQAWTAPTLNSVALPLVVR